MKSKSGPRYNAPLKRKKEQKTNYVKRLAILKSGLPRFVLRVTNKLVIAQIVTYKKEGDVTLLSVTSNDLKKKYGWNYNLKNTPSVYLTSLLLAKQAKKKEITKVVFDLGLKSCKKGSKMFAALQAIKDAGLECSFNEEALPSIDRIKESIFLNI